MAPRCCVGVPRSSSGAGARFAGGGSPAEVGAFAADLKEHQLAKTSDGSTVLDKAVLEHNLLAVSRLYQNISTTALGQLLGVDADRAEADGVHERAPRFNDAFITALRMFDLEHTHDACSVGPALAQHVSSAEYAGTTLEMEYHYVMQAALDEAEEERRHERVRAMVAHVAQARMRT